MPQISEDWQGALRALTVGWNSYDAAPISEKAIEAVKWFCVTPTTEGGIQLERHGYGQDFEMEIAPDGRIKSVYFENSAPHAASQGEREEADAS